LKIGRANSSQDYVHKLSTGFRFWTWLKLKTAMGMLNITGMLSSETRGMVQRTWLFMDYKKLVLLSKTIDV